MSQNLFHAFQPLAAIATTPEAVQQLQPLCGQLGATIWVPPSLKDLPGTQTYSGSLKEHLATLWPQQRAFIFALALGATTRLIAPLLQDKYEDPAVVLLDQQQRFVISVCGGHHQGADQLTRLISRQLGLTPILTGACNSQGLPGVDTWGFRFGWRKGEGDWTGVSAAVARKEKVTVIQEAGSSLWEAHLPAHHPFLFKPQEESGPCIWISHRKLNFSKASYPQAQWHPRVLWLGIGCERGTAPELISGALKQVLEKYQLAEEAIAGVGSLDIKKDEVGIQELCSVHNWPFKTFPASELANVDVPNPSQIVAKAVGTPSVAEAAAILASGNELLLVSKEVHRSPEQSGAVTIAIALGTREYIDHPGQLLLVGIGPGELTQMTPAAQTALTQADAVIGYSLYIKLIAPLLKPGQIVEALPITQERQRAQRAIELANWGLSVAVVSSGDAGIYGMAGLVLEELRLRGWDGREPKVEVFPGITALQAAAARVGTPLMHDFCAISLSDLLTPWEMIVKRLEAAAQADFVTALYNPRSLSRQQQIAEAREIFLKFRSSLTPVALVTSAYRQEESVTVTNLEKMLDFPIDMLTTVLIGNSSTRNYANWLITPRGYLPKD